MKASQLAKLLEVTIPVKAPVLIKGKPGIGKTSIVEQVCDKLRAELILDHPVVSDPTDYKGLPFPANESQQGKGAVFLPFGNLKRIMTAKKLTVMHLDDFGQAPPLVQAACMQLLLARRIGEHKVSDNVCFVASTNRRVDKAGVMGLLEPVKSRFVTIVELEVDLEDWVAWALNAGIPTEQIAFTRFRPGLLCDFHPTAELTNSPSPRTAHNIAKLLKAGLPRELEYEAFAGAAGEGYAAEFLAFLKIYRNLPNPDMVLLAPDKADVPTDPATLYAICGALARKASTNTMERLVRYANRLPAEFSVLLVRDSVRQDEDTVNTRAFIEWASSHSDVLI